MFAALLQNLLERKLVTRREVQEVTGRGASTVHRWVKNESEPGYNDLRLLLKHLHQPDAKQAILGMLTSDLPLSIRWLSDEEQSSTAPLARLPGGPDPLDAIISSLSSLAEVLDHQRKALRSESVSEEDFASIVQLIDRALRYAITGRTQLANRVSRRRKAKQA